MTKIKLIQPEEKIKGAYKLVNFELTFETD